MSRIAQRLVGFCLAIVVASATAAEQPRGMFIIWGAGNDSCARFLQERDQDSVRFRMQMSWIAGAVSHENATFGLMMLRQGIEIDLLKGLDYAALEAWLVNYCKQNPLNNVKSAASALSSMLYDRHSEYQGRLKEFLNRPNR